MSTMHESAESPYEAALAEERLKWRRLELPQPNVNEQLKARAEWSAAAERARVVARRTREGGDAGGA